ncbi:hypothetical protein Tco_0492020 [Tanacetum coccineum]
MQLTQKLRDDQKRMKKAFEDVSGSLNVRVPPRQGISLQSTSCKLDLTCDCAVADMENIFHLFEPLSKTNSFSTLEV